MAPVRFSEDVRARIPTREEETFFAMAEGQQVFEIIHISWLADGRAIEVSRGCTAHLSVGPAFRVGR